MRDVFLSRVSENRLRDGIGLGLIAGAATAGTLMGFGHVRGATLQPLNAIAHMLVGSRAFMTTGFQPLITGGALVIHFLSTILWGVLLAYVAAPLSGVTRALAPAGVGIFAYLVDRFLAPNALRPGFEELLSSGETTFIYVVLAAALAAGLWVTGPRLTRD
ncbi:MAG: hypothetical protein JJD97_01335 [Gemmatimonadaceae bacterium]|nr:hypothetical protein [Gemmatimonadaceae bacterium]